LQRIRRNIDSIEEDSNDGIIILGEGSVDVSISKCAIAGSECLDVVFMREEVPTLKFPSWSWLFVLAQKFTLTRVHTEAPDSNWSDA
jgi:hypothetical protein